MGRARTRRTLSSCKALTRGACRSTIVVTCPHSGRVARARGRRRGGRDRLLQLRYGDTFTNRGSSPVLCFGLLPAPTWTAQTPSPLSDSETDDDSPRLDQKRVPTPDRSSCGLAGSPARPSEYDHGDRHAVHRGGRRYLT